jgi:hypothetical protein
MAMETLSQSDGDSQEEEDEWDSEANFLALKELFQNIKNTQDVLLKEEYTIEINEELRQVDSDAYFSFLHDPVINAFFNDLKDQFHLAVKSPIDSTLSVYQDWQIISELHKEYPVAHLVPIAVELAFNVSSLREDYESADDGSYKEHLENQIKNLLLSPDLTSLPESYSSIIFAIFIDFFKRQLTLKFTTAGAVIFSAEDEAFFSLIEVPTKGEKANCFKMLKFELGLAGISHRSNHQVPTIHWQTIAPKKGIKNDVKFSIYSLKTSIEGESISGSMVFKYFSKAGFEHFVTSTGMKLEKSQERSLYDKKNYLRSTYYIFNQDKDISLAMPDWILLYAGNTLLPESYVIRSCENLLNFFAAVPPPSYRDFVEGMEFDDQRIINPASNKTLRAELIERWLWLDAAEKNVLLDLFPEYKSIIEQVSQEKQELLKPRPKKSKKKAKKTLLPKSLVSPAKAAPTRETKVTQNSAVVKPESKKGERPSKQPQPKVNKNKQNRARRNNTNFKSTMPNNDLRPFFVLSPQSPSKPEPKKGTEIRADSGKTTEKKKESQQEDQVSEPQATVPVEESKAEGKEIVVHKPIKRPNTGRIEQAKRLIKNHLGVNFGILECLNSVNAGISALFHGPQVFNDLERVRNLNRGVFNAAVRSSVEAVVTRRGRIKNGALQRLLEENRAAEPWNRLVLESALRQKADLEQMLRPQNRPQ